MKGGGDDVVGVRPCRRPGIDVSVQSDPPGLVRHVAAGHQIRFHRAAIPAGDGFALIVSDQLFAVIGKNGVPVLDILVVLQDRLSRAYIAIQPIVPLQTADPENHFGDLRCARILLDAEKLLRVDGEALDVKKRLLVVEIVAQEVQHLALKTFQMLHGDVEKIPGAGRRIENAEMVEMVMKCLYGLDRCIMSSGDMFREGRTLDILPLLPQGFDHRR